MLDWMQNLFTTGGFIPHGHCYLWKPELVWLHVISDSLIAIAYYSIPLTLFYFVRKRQDLPFNWVFLLFGSFIVACGTTHLMEVWTLWHPTYWLAGLLKVVTAVISIYTAICLVSLLPKALALPSLAIVNRKLEREISDRQQAEAALTVSEQRLRLALEAAHMGTWDWDILTNQIVWSEEHERLFGLVPGTFDGSYEAFDKCLHPDDREALIEAVNHAHTTHTDYSHEYRVIWLDGSIHWIEGKGKFLYDNAGSPVRVVGTVQDISFRKQTEAQLQQAKDDLKLRVAERTAELLRVNQQLQQELNERTQIQTALELSQARFAGILEIASDAIISVDGNQMITLFNQGAEKIFGYNAEEVVGQPLDLLLPNRSVALHRQHLSGFAQSSGSARRMGDRSEIFGCRKDGSEFPAEASISRLKLGTETIFTAILRDITDRKQIDRMKDEFISVVSHELRTPLTSIHGSLGMLASGLLKPDSDQGKRMLQIAVDSTDRLVRLINDILDIERIESGRVKMEKTLCAVDDLITEAVNVVQPLADKVGVILSVTSLSIEVWADPDRIIQTLTNLLSNAIKFSPAGSTVWLTAEEWESGRVGECQGRRAENLIPPIPPSPPILVTVTDHGRGIPANKLDSIFERFQQVDSSDSRNHEGTGLGLAICRSIVQQHDGQIWVESRLGAGSTFSFTLPLSVDSAIEPSTPPHDAIAGHDTPA
ncbi:MAG: PAS domain S-box protein [Leptolyngbyaceae cyanobacterium bins.302]|nr:PAS domain S-box protein [Leptolyngbyaceae cyanobacterium bins.302]